MTIDKVKEILASQLNKNIDIISGETKLIEDLGADSLDMVELLMLLEEDFGISIPDEDAMKIRTVNDIVNLIESK